MPMLQKKFPFFREVIQGPKLKGSAAGAKASFVEATNIFLAVVSVISSNMEKKARSDLTFWILHKVNSGLQEQSLDLHITFEGQVLVEQILAHLDVAQPPSL